MPLRSALFALALLPAAAVAQLDPEADAPYRWRVVVAARQHPAVTPALRDHVRRDLLAALQPPLGKLGTVEVVDLATVPREKWEPLWTQFDANGWRALDASRELTGAKTHFLTLEYRDGTFHLEARQHDGFSGLSSPLVRRRDVRSADLVGRAAGLMLDRDFGPVGTVEPKPGRPDEATLRLRGGRLGGGERFVRSGDVFAVAAVSKETRAAPPPLRNAAGKLIDRPADAPPPTLTASPRKFTLLRATGDPADGVVPCKVLTAFDNPFPMTGPIAGYRAMKLAAVESPVAVRLVGTSGATHPRASLVQVRATDSDFAAPPRPADNLDFRDGMYRSSRSLSKVACVVVAAGLSQRPKRFAVPVLGPDPITLEFEFDPAREEQARYERELADLGRRIADARGAQVALFDALARLIGERKNPAALARAEAGQRSAAADEAALRADYDRLKPDAARSPLAPDILPAYERQLQAIGEGQTTLAARLADLQKVVAQENDPSRSAEQIKAQSMANRIKLLIQQGDIDAALAAYDQLVAAAPANDEVKRRRDRLRKEWEPRSPAHAQAREFLAQTWPGLATLGDYQAAVPRLQQSVAAVKAAGDRLTFRRLLPAFAETYTRLARIGDALDGDNDADRKAAAELRTIAAAVRQAEKEAQEYLNTAPPVEAPE